jgi:hypothetical protein
MHISPLLSTAFAVSSELPCTSGYPNSQTVIIVIAYRVALNMKQAYVQEFYSLL